MRFCGKYGDEKGQALLESALTTLVFLILLIGVIDVGQVLWVHQSIVERVRAAVRYGAVRAYDEDAIRNMVLYDQATVPGGGGSSDFLWGDHYDHYEDPAGFLGLTAGMVTVLRQDATYNEDRLIVTVHDYPFTFFTPFIAGVYTGKPISASLPYEVP